MKRPTDEVLKRVAEWHRVIRDLQEKHKSGPALSFSDAIHSHAEFRAWMVSDEGVEALKWLRTPEGVEWLEGIRKGQQ